MFNPEKLQWLNVEYIKQGESRSLAERLLPFLEKQGYDRDGCVQPRGGIEAVIPHLRDRTKTLVEMADWTMPYIVEPVTMDEVAAGKFLTPAIAPSLHKFAERVKTIEPFSKETLEPVVHTILEEEQLKMGKLAQPLRVALTGRTFSPGIYEVMELLGKDRTLIRIERALNRIGS